jgi:hypothetical protein
MRSHRSLNRSSPQRGPTAADKGSSEPLDRQPGGLGDDSAGFLTNLTARGRPNGSTISRHAGAGRLDDAQESDHSWQSVLRRPPSAQADR